MSCLRFLHTWRPIIRRAVLPRNSGAGRFGLIVLMLMTVWGADSGAAACDRDRLIVALDIGHSVASPGATSARGRPEHAFNVDLASQVLAHMHAAGLSGAALIAPADAALDLWERPRRAAAMGAHLLLSIHHDSVQPRYLEQGTLDGRPARFSRHAQGYSLFISGKNLFPEESLAVAKAIGRALADWGLSPSLHHAEPIAGENRPLLDPDLGIYDFADLVVLKAAAMPAVLIEAGVIVHPEEEARLRDPFHQDILAEAITRGVVEACGVLVGGE
ncbi:N-acetylmuramoyl-L-alanine amidase [Rhodospira trueperi]|uniref:N-acetylmuramoyl-L-alanine amidase n=2 Tax=Rhodospira trueperi TaxID=69960 RepID=A0A1G7ADY9_9PROT|nr:N-acetylmuramoyl-L-alanine amidase [Rhodospira trueperi]